MKTINKRENKISSYSRSIKTVPITSLKGILPKPSRKVTLKDMEKAIGTGRKYAGI